MSCQRVHKWKLSVRCMHCERESEHIVRRVCFKELGIYTCAKKVGCIQCRTFAYMYWHCDPGNYDVEEREVGCSYDIVVIRVDNLDEV